ncbi:MAG: hypothetical protein H6Q36_227 [Chloroflexi bacterium]|nr:hypothetical protein [Chloroflexota bacterium]
MSRAGAEELTWPLAGLLAEPPGASRDLAADGVLLDLGPDVVQDSPLSVRVHVARTNRGVIVRARLETSVAETCSRCLRPASVPLALELVEEVLPSIDLASGLPLDADAEPDAPRLSAHHELELEPIARDAIWMAEPIAPLCRPDCPGLCPICGADLASGPHDHGEEPVDPRLQALRGFSPDEG